MFVVQGVSQDEGVEAVVVAAAPIDAGEHRP
jgi:hypothetical protein